MTTQATYQFPDLEAQMAFGALLGRTAPLSALVRLEGDLGAGKTTLARGILRGLGYEGTVRSPTYTLMEPYEAGGRHCVHFDLYRLADPEELEFLGIRDLLAGENLILVEWPDKGEGVLPAGDLVIHLNYLSQGREIELLSQTRTGEAWLKRLTAEASGTF
jgi:tRNA threonylcarbamoyladenosine biosynthesis protein TsaE